MSYHIVFKTQVIGRRERCDQCGSSDDTWSVTMVVNGEEVSKETGGGCFGPALNEWTYARMLANYFNYTLEDVALDEEGEEVCSRLW